MAVRPGSMGQAVPGHEVAVIDAGGQVLPDGEMGEIAVRAPDPVMFLRYWNLPEKTAEKFTGDWMRTGDLGRRDADGYFWYVSRDDDVITSAGYRIGPTEIETCLTGHPDVVMAAVVGVPDPVRTEAVKAFVVLREGADWDGLPEALIGPGARADQPARGATRCRAGDGTADDRDRQDHAPRPARPGLIRKRRCARLDMSPSACFRRQRGRLARRVRRQCGCGRAGICVFSNEKKRPGQSPRCRAASRRAKGFIAGPWLSRKARVRAGSCFDRSRSHQATAFWMNHSGSST